MVFSYVGPSHPDFDHTVLRLRKEGPEAQIEYAELTDNDPNAGQDSEEPDDPSISFQAVCMKRLIPPVHLPRLDAVRVSPAWLRSLLEMHHDSRPEKRQQRAGLDLSKHKGVLATDLVGGETIAVEIKVSGTVNHTKLSANKCISSAQMVIPAQHLVSLRYNEAHQGKDMPILYAFSNERCQRRHSISWVLPPRPLLWRGSQN